MSNYKSTLPPFSSSSSSTSSSSSQSQGNNENEFGKTVRNPFHSVGQQRLPLNSIPDPSQFLQHFGNSDNYHTSSISNPHYLKVENISIKSDSGDKVYGTIQQPDDGVQYVRGDYPICSPQSDDMSKELMEAKDLIKALKTERVSLIEELHFVRQGYHELDESLENRGLPMFTLDDHGTGGDSIHQDLAPSKEGNRDISGKYFHFKLKEITKNIEEDRVCSSKCPENQALLLTYGKQAGLNRDKVKAKTVSHLQDEVAALQSLFEERLCSMAEDNEILRIRLAEREDEIRETHAAWEKASLELTSFLLDGSKSLTDASDQIKLIVGSFPHRNVDVCNHVEMAAKACLEKEETILILEKSLEDAQQTILQMEQKLDSLKGAAMVLIDHQQLQNAGTAKESVHSITNSDDKINLIEVIEEKLTCKENQITEANKHADASFLAVNSLENHMVTSASADYAEEYSLGNKAQKTTHIMNNFPPECTMVQVELAKLGLQEIESAFNTAFADSEMYLSSLHTDIHTTVSLYTEIVQEFVNNIQEMKESCLELNTNSRYVLQVPESSKKVVESKILQQIFDELSHINKKMSSTRDCIISVIDMFGCSAADKLLVDENSRTANSLTTPFATLSVESNAPRLHDSSCSGCHPYPVLLTDKALGFESAWLIKRLDDNETAMVSLSKEFRMVYNAFTKINVQLAALFSDGEVKDQTCFIKSPELVSNKCENLSIIGFDQVLLSKLNRVLPPSLLGMQEAQTGCCNTKEFFADENMNHANSFFEQFEEARETMQEADSIINALLNANENSRQLTGMWKQIGEYLLAEKANMTEEIEQLKSSVHLKDGENEMLQDQIHHIFIELADLMTLLEGSFSHMQTDMEQMFEAVYSDGLSMGTDFLSNICSARLSVEEIFASAMEKDLASFVFLRFIAAEYPKNFRSLDVDVSSTRFQGSLINDLCSNSVCMKDNAVEVEKVQTLITARTEAVVVNLVYEDTAVETLELRKVDEENDTLLKGVAPYAASVDLEQAKGKLNMLLDQNEEFNVHSLDLGLKKLEAEEQLLEQREDVRTLEREILTTRSSTEKQLLSCLKIFHNDLKTVSEERDQLREQLLSLKDKLEKNYALLDENEAIAVVARQELEASRIYAEQKEDEVKILEHSVEELECTINVLETKVYEMEEEVERHQIIRDSSELEIQALRDRLLTVRIDQNSDSENSRSPQLAEVRLSRELQYRTMELHEAHKQIISLEDKIAEQAKEIKKCKKNITEVVLHAEAQSSQYHHKYKMLEAMVREIKTDSSNLASSSATLGKMDKSSMRSRGSSSPFRCIGGFTQQKNSEQYQELSIARLRIEELEALLAGRQKEVCMLNIRLASAESMTHDVIRDLLRVKVDMTGYANLMEQYQLQKSAEEAQQQTHQSIAMEREILNLKKQINELLEERHICILEVNRREAVICSIQMTVEQLKEREQLLSSQNEVLKFDKNNLQRRVAALDDMVKRISGTHTSRPRVQQQIDSLLSSTNTDYNKRLSNSGKQLLHGDNELPQYYKSDGNHRINELERYSSEKMFRKHKV